MDQPFNPYTVLGIEVSATAEQVTLAYRRASSKAHPDRKGGSKEAQTDVNMAYKQMYSILTSGVVMTGRFGIIQQDPPA